MWFAISDVDLGAALRTITDKLEQLMADINQVRADYRNWGQALIEQRDAALALASAATAKAKENADALQAFVDNDAATDASQLAEQQSQDAQAFQDDLDALKAQDTPGEPIVPGGDQPQDGDVPPPVEEPPAEEARGKSRKR